MAQTWQSTRRKYRHIDPWWAKKKSKAKWRGDQRWKENPYDDKNLSVSGITDQSSWAGNRKQSRLARIVGCLNLNHNLLNLGISHKGEGCGEGNRRG